MIVEVRGALQQNCCKAPRTLSITVKFYTMGIVVKFLLLMFI